MAGFDFRSVAVAVACAMSLWPIQLRAQDPFEGDLDQELGSDESDPEVEDEAETGESAEPESEEAPEDEPSAPEGDAEAKADVFANVDLNVATAEDKAEVDAQAATAGAGPTSEVAPVVTGSRIRRERQDVEGAEVNGSPLRTEVQGRDYLQMRRQLGGMALPDTTAALGLGGAGTDRLELRLQPTLILLNGRRLVSSPFIGRRGSDYVDINQLPIPLIERVETTYGMAAGLYGEDAIGGVHNFITKRDFDGFELELGGQATGEFDQHETDISLTFGGGAEKSGMTGMVSYFNRQPLAASDRAWMGERRERTLALLGYPANYQPLVFVDYPVSDPYCPLAQNFGQSLGYEPRLRRYGILDNIEQLKEVNPEEADILIGNQRNLPGADPTTIEALETATYCGTDYSPNWDLVIKDERIQTYVTAWHALSDHTEAFAELGYYRTENENRTRPGFPVLHFTPDINDITPTLVPGNQPDDQSTEVIYDIEHADIPAEEYGFASTALGEPSANSLFLVGATQGPFNGSGANKRRVDVLRGVIGLQGDFAGLAPTGLLSTWDWDVVGTYTTTDSVSRVRDTLLNTLKEALESCPITKATPAGRVPTTIKERQELGCFNPFYSSVVNNVALDPFGVSSGTVANTNGFITSDTETRSFEEGYGRQDGGYICDPNDPNSPPCPAEFDQDGDGFPELAGTPNTQQVIDSITGEHITETRRTLAVVDAGLTGNLAKFGGGGLDFALGAQFRRETLQIDHDQAYNENQYGFLYGGPDVDPIARNIFAGFAEARLSLASGLFELQPAVGLENYEEVGTGLNALIGLSLRPLAGSTGPLEWLMLRAHAGRGVRAPTLIQGGGSQTEFVTVDYRQSTLYVPHVISGNPDLDFEVYTTVGGGLQWDFAGLHVGLDGWMTHIDDVIGADNARTLVNDCWEQFQASAPECMELALLADIESLDHVRSSFDNMAEVDTNGVDGGISYTFDTKRRGLGDFGTFYVALQATYINSYLINSPRGLRHFYRECKPGATGRCLEPVEGHTTGEHAVPEFDMATGVRDYSNIKAEYEAAGWRNAENFAPPIPKLRFAVPVRYGIDVHSLGFTVRYVDGYNDDSEATIEELGLPGVDQVQLADGEAIPSFTVFDASYGFWFGDAENWKIGMTIGVLNIADTPPPAVFGGLGYEVGVHDPRGRMVYARLRGEM